MPQAPSLRAGSFKVGREARSLPRSACAWQGPGSRECVTDTSGNKPQESVHPRDPPHAPQTALTAGNQMLMGNMPHSPHSKFSNAPALKDFPTSAFIHLFSGAEVKIRASWLLGKCSTTELQSKQTSFIIFNTRRISLEKPSPRFFRIRDTTLALFLQDHPFTMA